MIPLPDSGRISLNKKLLQGPDQQNQLVGVLSRFRQETAGMVTDIRGMFHQALVEPKWRFIRRIRRASNR